MNTFYTTALLASLSSAVQIASQSEQTVWDMMAFEYDIRYTGCRNVTLETIEELGAMF